MRSCLRRTTKSQNSAAFFQKGMRGQNQFHIIGIMRRLADYYLNKAPTLDEMKKAHRKFIRDYNAQIHFAHRERQDVLRGVLARTLPAPTLARIFFATEFIRCLDRSGYIRFRRWRFYAEEGLARKPVQVSIYTSTLKIEYEERVNSLENEAPCSSQLGMLSPRLSQFHSWL